MKYTYAYKTSDGTRHTASMDAASREAVFEALRARGIRAIKVVAADGSKANGEVPPGGKSHTEARIHGVVAGVVISAACVAAAVAVWQGWARLSRQKNQVNYYVEKEMDERAGRSPAPTIAAPLPRQAIPGDRKRIAAAAQSLTNAAERFLAAFAEPGRPLPDVETPTAAEFAACLREPLRIAEDEFTESVDLKRIVTRIKGELRRFLAAGGTVEGFAAELAKRQQLEIAYREKAEKRLGALLEVAEGEGRLKPLPPINAKGKTTTTTNPPQTVNAEEKRTNGAKKDAYEFWLKANAQLQSMGIYPLPMPDALRECQMSLDFED